MKNRQINNSLKETIKTKRETIKKIRLIHFALDNAMKEINSKNSKLIPKKIFQNCIFRGKKRILSFERKNAYSPYLFYATYSSPIILHLQNLYNLISRNFNFYNAPSYWFDVEQHNGRIYICGGFYGKFLNDSWSLILNNFKNPNIIQTNNLVIARGHHTLVSTPFDLFVL